MIIVVDIANLKTAGIETKMKDFVKKLISALHVSKDGNHVGVVLSANNARLLFSLVHSFAQKKLSQAVDAGISLVNNEQADIDKALMVARTELTGPTSRSEARKLLFVVVPGAPSDPSSWTESAQVTNAGIDLVSVGVATNSRISGSKPSSKGNVLTGTIDSMGELAEIIKIRYFVGKCSSSP